jgi:serine/threonine-protein kinase ATR
LCAEYVLNHRSTFYAYQSLGILLALKRAEEVFEPPLLSVNATLPPASGITEFWPDMQNLVAVPQDLQRTITTPTQAVYVGFRLSQALLESYIVPSQQRDTPDTHEHLRLWALDACTSLWKGLRKWSLRADAHFFQDEIQTMYMDQLKILAFPKAMAPDDFANSQKAALCLTSGLLDMLQICSTSAVSEPNQTRLASLLAHLRNILMTLPEPDHPQDRRWQNLILLITESMEPSITKCCRDVEKLTSFHPDLQVCLAPTVCLSQLIPSACAMPLDCNRCLAR